MDAATVLGSFVRMRYLQGLSRRRFEAWQNRALRRWLRTDVPRVAAYGQAQPDLSKLPVTDKARVMDDFAAYNVLGLSAETCWAALESGTPPAPGYLTGASTGTSGNRGLFVISDRERFRWLGSILAKALPDVLWRRHRVAVILPRNTGLYDSARQSRLLQLRFFDLTAGPDHWSTDLEEFEPTVVIAPPRILRYLAEATVRISPVRVYAGAETLDAVDRPIIEGRFGVKLGQIYMATEGLFAVTCPEGTLHLAEDSTYFEFEDAGGGLVNPLVSTFQRQAQILCRYRMNDLLRLADAPCPCGSPLRAVTEVVGRMDDVFRLGSTGILITPDVLRNAVVNADRRITDFRIRQIDPEKVELILPVACEVEAAQKAHRALQECITARHPAVVVDLRQEVLTPRPDRKLRRVTCCL